jgi:hypothetical protein
VIIDNHSLMECKKITTFGSKQELVKKQQPVVTGLRVASFTNQYCAGPERSCVNTITHPGEGINSA